MFDNNSSLYCDTIYEWCEDEYYTFRLKRVYAYESDNEIGVRRVDGIWRYKSDFSEEYHVYNYGYPDEFDLDIIKAYNRRYMPYDSDGNWFTHEDDFFEDLAEEWNHEDPFIKTSEYDLDDSLGENKKRPGKVL